MERGGELRIYCNAVVQLVSATSRAQRLLIYHLNLGHRRAVPDQKPIFKWVYTFL